MTSLRNAWEPHPSLMGWACAGDDGVGLETRAAWRPPRVALVLVGGQRAHTMAYSSCSRGSERLGNGGMAALRACSSSAERVEHRALTIHPAPREQLPEDDAGREHVGPASRMVPRACSGLMYPALPLMASSATGAARPRRWRARCRSAHLDLAVEGHQHIGGDARGCTMPRSLPASSVRRCA